VGPVGEPDAVVRRVAITPLVCVGSRLYFERHGMPKTPAELVVSIRVQLRPPFRVQYWL
jgi:hypothetical protein